MATHDAMMRALYSRGRVPCLVDVFPMCVYVCGWEGVCCVVWCVFLYRTRCQSDFDDVCVLWACLCGSSISLVSVVCVSVSLSSELCQLVRHGSCCYIRSPVACLSLSRSGVLCERARSGLRHPMCMGAAPDACAVSRVLERCLVCFSFVVSMMSIVVDQLRQLQRPARRPSHNIIPQ